ncbi:MAG: hypothetical protein JXX28_11935 [Deltaproteobacteria bacterium]|nr:hypothetical protein [Deltaproteobacteria bacterium]
MNVDTPFQIWLMREPGAELMVSLRFQVDTGLGALGLRLPGRVDPSPSTAAEESRVGASVLQASRFIHLPEGSQRRNSYAFSRLAPSVIGDLSFGDWVELEVITEYGFRYLVVPGQGGTAATPSPASVQVAGPRPARVQVDSEPAVARIRVGATHGAVPPPSANLMEDSPPPSPAPVDRRGPEGLPPRSMPMDPSLGAAALRALNREKAVALLKNEMAKTAELHQRLELLEGKLRAAEDRERDLLELLQRWQARERDGARR